ncbi:hypothetical protein [Fodinicurvata fenggangensis]|uniref:hypothetical protein n=1 Tax=Fodinicurvata fenggangensis TaxID=1121830 RepID=UPI00047AF1F8|nr:hypothetical protein [Fodinicurvata fenggangensis]
MMSGNRLYSVMFAGILLVASSASALAQNENDNQETHHPEQNQSTDQPQPGAAERPGGMPGMMGTMPGMRQMMPDQEGMGRMGPGMMSQMGPSMMGRGMMGGGMMGQMGQGAMGQAQMPMAGMMCPMMQAMTGVGGHGKGHPGMAGPGILYGIPENAQNEMTPDQVRGLLERRLAHHGNPRLEVGDIVAEGEATITAEIVTVDGSLVQKLAFNRFPGLVRQITE